MNAPTVSSRAEKRHPTGFGTRIPFRTFYVVAVTWLGLGVRAPSLSAVNWTAPQSGWLYVLDAGGRGDDGQILLLDPEGGAIHGLIRAGHQPDFAISPDGAWLYVTAGLTGRGRLFIINTASGNVVRTVDLPDRVMYIVRPNASTLAVSNDGRFLYFENMRMLAPGVDEYTIGAVDTLSGRVLPDSAPIPGCGLAQLLPGFGSWDLMVHCRLTNSVRLIKIGSTGKHLATRDLPLPGRGMLYPDHSRIPEVMRHAAQVFDVPDGSRLSVIMADGGGAEVPIGGSAAREVNIAGLQTNLWLSAGEWPHSSGDGLVYIGSGPRENRVASAGTVLDIQVVDTTTWRVVRGIHLDQPMWTAQLSKDGRVLYAISLSNRSITSIDASTGNVLRVVREVGQQPALAMTVP